MMETQILQGRNNFYFAGGVLQTERVERLETTQAAGADGVLDGLLHVQVGAVVFHPFRSVRLVQLQVRGVQHALKSDGALRGGQGIVLRMDGQVPETADHPRPGIVLLS
eukprot:CAMPEP_0194320798 /NCGR_PEP_ID=MMETSP0171-20130528/17083_1 /TAXON_ID=218684 /ORGANISM="Corethron pennatum, Strain L29A3" /LENGTH=108 /DNA_ID=CAMNT_0039078463 /DNA_START=408 /DNA_END=734 /DNA_ORIENTATION=+